MKKYCGPLLQVTEVEFLDRGQGATIDTIQIGRHTLRKVKLDHEMASFLQPNSTRDVCLYIFRILFTPNLLGIKFMDTGEKHIIPFSFVRNSVIRYFVVCTIVYSIGGALLGGFLGNVAALGLGIESLKDVSTSGYGFVGGIALAWWYCVSLAMDYARARAA